MEFEHTGSYCKCNFYDIINNESKNDCCGEDNIFEWKWDNSLNPEAKICKNKQIVQFHPVYSQGTSVVRGENFLTKNQHHFWEVKIITETTGTDIMLGIGTDKLDLLSHQYRFASFLGIDDQSWGYSYRGLSQHNGRLKYYGKKFSQGSIISIHLDLIRGTLEFYSNRRPQGIAFRKIPVNDINIFPMACSTSAKSSIKLINSVSFDETLQYFCMKTIAKQQNLVEQVEKIPGLQKILKQFWFLQCKDDKKNKEFKQNNLLLEDEAICGLKKNKIRKKTEGSDEITNNYKYPCHWIVEYQYMKF